MKIEKQVCSLELAKKLKELGVKQESYLWWDGNGRNSGFDLHAERPLPPNRMYNRDEAYSAFTVAELGAVLELHYLLRSSTSRDRKWTLTVQAKPNGIGAAVVPSVYSSAAETEADARAEMLIYLIGNGLLKP